MFVSLTYEQAAALLLWLLWTERQRHDVSQAERQTRRKRDSERERQIEKARDWQSNLHPDAVRQQLLLLQLLHDGDHSVWRLHMTDNNNNNNTMLL